LFPNPAVTSAALATITRRIQLRAGSVVLPLHHPVRVAEEWSVVDNLSGGRVGLSIASGWHANDFVLAPERYARRHEAMWEDLRIIQALWRGEPHRAKNGLGQDIEVRLFPSPVQKELPVWITAASSAETFVSAGAAGANVLTFLLGQSHEALAKKIGAYRAALAAHGFRPDHGKVAVMLHAFVGDDPAAVKATVRAPLRGYLRSATELSRPRPVPPDKMEDLLDLVFEQYYASALIGTPARGRETVARLAALGVDEACCLIDFGVPDRLVLEALEKLDEVRQAVG
jgi:natural product biosynthesis luciferase-like monooxygenase protein